MTDWPGPTEPAAWVLGDGLCRRAESAHHQCVHRRLGRTVAVCPASVSSGFDTGNRSAIRQMYLRARTRLNHGDSHETFARVRHRRLRSRPRCRAHAGTPTRGAGSCGTHREPWRPFRTCSVRDASMGERCRVRRKARTAAVQISRAASAPSAIATSTSLGDTLSPAMSTRTPSLRRASASPSHASGASHTTTRSIPAIADSRPV